MTKTIRNKKNIYIRTWFLSSYFIFLLLLEFVPVALGLFESGVDGNFKAGNTLLTAVLAAQFFVQMIFLWLLVKRFGKIVALVNFLLIIIILYVFNFVLKKNDPFLKLPFDSGYYFTHIDKYEGLVKPPDSKTIYTWGHKVVKNRFGFREREFVIPKPSNTFRIMILGDSLTYGVGLALEERYSNLLETMIKENYSHLEVDFEVLNFGFEGAPTTQERDSFKQYGHIVKPDMVIVGFCVNDVQPRSEDFSVEKERYKRKFGLYKKNWRLRFAFLKLHYIGDILVRFMDKVGRKLYGVPPWHVSLGRVYDKNSREWNIFVDALKDIVAISNSMNLSAPVFATLTQSTYFRQNSDQENPSDKLRILLSWFKQVRDAAKEAGFDVINYEPEIFSRLTKKELLVKDLVVCPLDGHPSRFLNQIYAEKMYEKAAQIIKQKYSRQK